MKLRALQPPRSVCGNGKLEPKQPQSGASSHQIVDNLLSIRESGRLKWVASGRSSWAVTDGGIGVIDEEVIEKEGVCGSGSGGGGSRLRLWVRC